MDNEENDRMGFAIAINCFRKINLSAALVKINPLTGNYYIHDPPLTTCKEDTCLL